jgi:penicillin-binding protein 2
VEDYHRLLPGVQVHTRARRKYLYGPAFAHVVGYLGEVGNVQTSREGDLRRQYRAGDMIGKMGIEAVCEDSLRGLNAYKLVEVNAAGREILNPLEKWQTQRPVPGRDVTLTLAVALQESLYAAMAGQPGGAIALALPTGEVLAACSSPSFDPNLLTLTVSPAQWEQLASDPAKPFFNRVLQGTYAPGSLLKLVTSLCGLQHGVINLHTTLDPCFGSYQFGNRTFHCWKRNGHGVLDHAAALAHSCDVFYYQLGLLLDVDRLHEAACAFGLGQPCSRLFPEEVAGNVPTRAWYDQRYGKSGWTKGVMLNLAIGQGELLVTPLQMAVLAGAIATSGQLGRPLFLARGQVAPEKFLDLPFSSEQLHWAREGMEQVVDTGTGTAARLTGVPVAGKTGTTQNPHGEDHAWFMCYAPADAPAVAFAVILENAGHGGAAAAPLAARWLQAYFAWADQRRSM